MSLNYPKSGPNDTPQYQMSGVPHLTRALAPLKTSDPSDCLKISFPFVTRDITITNAGSVGLRVGFTAKGAINNAPHSIVIAANQTVKYSFRCKDLFLMSDNGSTTCACQIIAGLTNIKSTEFPVLTGSVDGVIAFEGVG